MRFRFSISDLMAVVLFISVAIASLTHPTQLCASLIYSLTLGVLCLAVLGTAFRVGESQRFWAGFIVFGWVTYLLMFPLASISSPSLPVTLLVDYSIQFLHPPRPTGPSSSVMTLDSPGQIAFYHIAYSLSVIVIGFIGAYLSRAVFRDGASARVS